MYMRSTKLFLSAPKIYRNLLLNIIKEENPNIKRLLQREAALLTKNMTDAELEEIENLVPEAALEFQGFSI